MTLLCYGHCYASSHGFDELGAPPSTLPTVGTNLIEINLKRRKKVTLRELGGCMSPIWPSYYSEASSVMISSSCIQLLSLLAAEPLQGVSVLLIFNKRDMPCLMGFIEMKSLFRLEEIIEFATQSITTLELSASTGQGLQDVVGWLESSPTK
uniref:ADP-ribosylation factor-like protein 16 n=1 Tax=Knipowitschia caucasica TaxID=637954 RepID=A0AAV2KDZ3_KNICA